MMTRRTLLSLPLAAAAQQRAPSQGRAGTPNVVVLLADDLGWADVGYHGGEIRTPNIDKLSREGMQLDRFYSCPVCSPTRSALMTGRWPMRLGTGYTVVRPWEDYGLPLEEHLMPQSFHAAGYQTAMAGKWHLGHQRRAFFPGARGFDSSYGHFNGAIDYFTHDREGGLDWHRDGKTLEEKGYSTELIGAEAVRRIKSRDKSRPFLLYVPFNAPHSPLQAPQALIDRYAGVKDEKRRVFSAMVDSMDQQVGAILGALDQEAIARDTIVLFFSDNGGPTNLGARNTPLRGAKASVFEGGIRVPAVLRWPGRVEAGSKSTQVMAAWDAFPTLAAAAGIKPAGKLPLDGVNLWAQIQGGSRTPREDIFFAIQNNVHLQHCLISREWKLIRDGESKHMLFNVEQDPTEKNDLAQAHPERVRELSARIDDWRKLAPPYGMKASTSPPASWKAPKRWADDAPR
ncbi:MAG: sulfatase-like hydrolase/transferase [Bryobacteraceae bacterium]